MAKEQDIIHQIRTPTLALGLMAGNIPQTVPTLIIVRDAFSRYYAQAVAGIHLVQVRFGTKDVRRPRETSSWVSLCHMKAELLIRKRS